MVLFDVGWYPIRADNGSHFVTRDPRDPSLSWPVTRMTRDPWPSPRPWHESITTIHESCWVHNYCLLFSAMMYYLKFWIWLIQWIFYTVCTVSLVVYTLHSNVYKLNTVNSSVLFFNLTSYAFTPHLRVKCFTSLTLDPHDPFTFLLTHLTHDPLTHCMLCAPLSALTGRSSFVVTLAQ